MSSNGNIFRVAAICAGNSPVPGDFPSQRPVTRSFDAFFDVRLNKRLGKNNRNAGDLRRHRAHYDVIVMCLLQAVVSLRDVCKSWECCFVQGLPIFTVQTIK